MTVGGEAGGILTGQHELSIVGQGLDGKQNLLVSCPVTQWCCTGRKGGRDHKQEPHLQQQESYSATTTQSSPKTAKYR